MFHDVKPCMGGCERIIDSPDIKEWLCPSCARIGEIVTIKKLAIVRTDLIDGEQFHYFFPADRVHAVLRDDAPNREELEKELWAKGVTSIYYISKNTIKLHQEIVDWRIFRRFDVRELSK